MPSVYTALRPQKLAPSNYAPCGDAWRRLPAYFKTERQPEAPPVLLAFDELPADMPSAEPPRDLGEARDAMLLVLRQYRDLGLYGFEKTIRTNSSDDLDDGMLTPEALTMFLRSREWLSQRRRLPGRKGISESSYCLKNWASRDVGYTFSGPFIAAGIAAGVRVRRDPGGSQNALITLRDRFDVIR